MKIADLSLTELTRRLAVDGLRIKTGPFVFSIRSKLEAVRDGLVVLYDQFPTVESDTFADFHISVDRAKGVRRWIRPQSIFEFDGEIPFKPLTAGQGFALLEWGMNWCIYNHAHAFLIIHGAVLERNGKALLMPAPSGSGKSTLCGALMTQGWRLLSDELILINPNNGLIYPLGRPISLKNNSIEVLKKFSPSHHITAPVYDTAKGTVAHMKPSPDSVMRCSELTPPRWVIFPQYSANAETQILSIEKADLCMRLIDNAFNYNILRKKGFLSMAHMVTQITGFSATYSNLQDVIHQINRLTDES
ncbi:HprK-related kinase A [Ferribacterium limneticum]|uniref:HprK-related kinase A n=1 Tax=Ferribacterium limneticum TaxID=76259 RepID=UPI001CF7F919|nr:HprK-related kinase A [Ferribacterium limneticum]UCV26689.1 HprK-related kinase A [Ferribacterium limneticum]UCV30606.1 HprK-related kinase A [Ferribacterium limneticum]